MLSHSVMSDSLQPHQQRSLVGYSSWRFSRQEYWSGLPCPPPRIFPTQGLNPGLPHCRWILYHLSHLRSPRTLERIAYPFSRGTSQPKNRTRVSCIADNSLPAELPGKPDFYNGFPQSDITLRHLFPTFQTTVDMCLAEPTHGSPKQQAL